MRRVTRLDEGTIACVSADDIVLAKMYGKVAIEILEQIRDILGTGCGMVKISCASVCCAKDSARLPGNDKQNAFIFRLWQDNGVVTKFQSIACKDQVDSLAWFNAYLRWHSRQFLQPSGEDAR